MAKSEKGSASGGKAGSKKPDGRRNNQPPESGKIKPKEILNPFGAAGKPRAAESDAVAALFQEVAQTLLPDDPDPVSGLLRRLIARDFHEAVTGKDARARVRALKALESIVAARESRDRAFRDQITSGKFEVEGEFYRAKKAGLPPPDILPHPAHVKVNGNEVLICGPVTAEDRENWEFLKFVLKLLVLWNEVVRDEHRRRPTAITRKYLSKVEKARRRLMRRVPKGWDWTEEIFTLGVPSMAAEFPILHDPDHPDWPEASDGLDSLNGPDDSDGPNFGAPRFSLTDDPPTPEPVESPEMFRRVVSAKAILNAMKNRRFDPRDFDFFDAVYPDDPEGHTQQAA